MTWEIVGIVNDDGSHTPKFWYVLKVIKIDANRLELYLVDPQADAFEGIAKPKYRDGENYVAETRRQWEKALKKAASDAEIYDELVVLSRLPDSLLDKASQLFQEGIEAE